MGKRTKNVWKDAERYLLKDKYVGPLVKKYGHCKIKPRRKSVYFEDLVDSIVQQQLSMKAAASIFNRIKEKITDKNDSGKVEKHRWRSDKTLNVKVTLERILSLSDKDLRACGLSNAKASYVKDLARRVKEGDIEIHKMDKLPDYRVMEELTAVKGIGRWTAEMFLMFTLAREDIFPVDDVGIVNGMKKLTNRTMDKPQMEKFAERWKPYKTAASWYIWASLDNG